MSDYARFDSFKAVIEAVQQVTTADDLKVITRIATDAAKILNVPRLTSGQVSKALAQIASKSESGRAREVKKTAEVFAALMLEGKSPAEILAILAEGNTADKARAKVKELHTAAVK